MGRRKSNGASSVADAVRHVADMLLAAVREPRAAGHVEAAQVAASQQQHAGVRDAMTVHDVQHCQLPQLRQRPQPGIRDLQTCQTVPNKPASTPKHSTDRHCPDEGS